MGLMRRFLNQTRKPEGFLGKLIVNAAAYAMQLFQEQMRGQAEHAGFESEDDIADWITQSRRKEYAEFLDI